MIDTTVVISNYNYARYVGSAIESCLDQTVLCNVIVVDDVSSDKSWKIISKYASHYDRVSGVLLKFNSKGNARGKNVGICLCNTKFVVCLDADDMLVPWSIESRVDTIGSNDFVHGWAKTIDSQKDYSTLISKHIGTLKGPVEYSKKIRKIEEERNEVRWTWAIQASTVLARKSMYEKFGLYDEEMRWSIDREMWWRCLSHNAKRKALSKYVSIYRVHPRQITRNPTVKNPRKRTKQIIARKVSRAEINSKTTLLIPDYNYKSFIDCVV